jgi:hypothetical protein
LGNADHSTRDLKLKVGDQLLSDPVDVANKFNNDFTSVASELEQAIPVSNVDPLSYLTRQPNSIVLFETDCD